MTRLKAILVFLAKGLASFYVFLCLLLFFLQESILFYPQELADDHVFTFHQTFEERFFDRPDGARIHGVLFHHAGEGPAKGVVFYLKGNGGTVANSGGIARIFTDVGLDVLSIDYRTYGKSHGSLSETALHADTAAIYQELVDEYGEDRTVLLGYSLGSGLALHLAVNTDPRQIILLAPYQSILDMGKRQYPFLPDFIARYPLRSDLALPQVSAPILAFHGTADQVIPYDASLLHLKGFKTDDEIFTIEGASHGNLPFQPTVVARIRETLRAEGPGSIN